MKKILSLTLSFTLLIAILLTGKTYAATLDSVSVDTDQSTIKAGEEVSLTVNFVEQLGAYTANITYDSNLLEYVSVTGGTANDTTGTVIITFYDAENPREDMTVVFKAKTDIEEDTSTEISITAEGLANADASVYYDDITTPLTATINIEATETTEDDTTNDDTENTTDDETSVTTLPTAGYNVYLPMFFILIALTGAIIYYNKNN